MSAAPAATPLVAPFRALRYADTASLSRLLAPPYDVIDASRRAELAASDEHNAVHVTLPEGGEDRYERAADLLQQWVSKEVMVLDPEPTVTVMRQRYHLPDGSERVRCGLFVSVAAESYEFGRVRPHERTHSGPKQDRLALLEATGVVTEPIFLLHRDEGGGVQAFQEKTTARDPDATAELEGVGLDLWVVQAADAVDVLEALESGPLYIADGHHRYETTAGWGAARGEPARVLGFIVPLTDPGLEVLPTHRILSGGEPDREEFLKGVAEVTQLAPSTEAEFTVLWPDGGTDPLTFFTAGLEDDAEEPGPADRLSIARVERHVVLRLLESAGEQARLTYHPDPAQVRLQVRTGAASAAVLVSPTRVEEVLEVADKGGVMPPKSTYFHPKVPGGVLMMEA